MTNYKALGLKCGLEIHQQLEGRKLFCACPTIITDDDASYVTIERTLRAVVGETGEIDAAALQEQQRAKRFQYRFYRESCCLVDLDEEPPGLMNSEAVETVLQVASLLNAQVVDEVQVMRKTVVDGSNTTGFQRTALVARQGTLSTSQGNIEIPTICLEEDAAKIIKREADQDVYNLSRLGIPLIEISTGPQITSPEHAREVAGMLGMLLRSTGRVKRGLGTIRQDVNISIKGGARIEIKGAQDLDLLPTLVANEAERQKRLLELREMLARSSLSAYKDVSSIFAKTNCKFVAKALASGQQVTGAVLTGLSGVVGKELQPGKRLGTDFSDYLKVKAGLGGIIHSDEDLAKYQFSAEEVAAVRKALACHSSDAFVLIIAPTKQAAAGFAALGERLSLLSGGVPKEVRKANDDGTTSYLRPMPGSARMYPETDTLPVDVRAVNVVLPELIDAKAERYQSELDLSEDLANLIAKGQNWKLFEEILKLYPSIKPASVAETLESVPAQLRRKYQIETEISPAEWKAVFTAVHAGKIGLANTTELFAKARQEKVSVQEAMKHFQLISKAEVERIVKQVVAEMPGAAFGAVMGKVMKLTGGKADGRLLSELVKKELK